MKSINNGNNVKPLKTSETTAGGRFSSLINWWIISGLATYAFKWSLSARLSSWNDNWILSFNFHSNAFSNKASPTIKTSSYEPDWWRKSFAFVVKSYLKIIEFFFSFGF